MSQKRDKSIVSGVMKLKAHELRLEELYLFHKHSEFSEQRIITVPTSALGTLKRELLETIGDERAKGFLLRYGWHCGVFDGKKIKKMNWDNDLEMMYAGPVMHSLHGYVEVIPEIAEIDIGKQTLRFEGKWKNSYEAQEHKKLYGISEEPVCHSLVGYASGYLSVILGKRVIVKEVGCEGMGHSSCRWVSKLESEWGDEIANDLVYYQVDNISQELAQTYKELKLERDNLNKAYEIQQKLTKEVLRESDLKSIALVLYQHAGMPVLIEDSEYQLLASGGMPVQKARAYSEALQQWFGCIGDEQGGASKTRLIEVDAGHRRAMVPIYLRRKIVGFCSFLYKGTDLQEVDKLILQHASMACSLYMQNEQTRFQAEQRMRGGLLEDIVNKRITMEDISQRGLYIDFPVKDTEYFMIAFKPLGPSRTMKENLEFTEGLMNECTAFFKERQALHLIGQKSGHVMVLLTEQQRWKDEAGKRTLCDELLRRCSGKFGKHPLALGISSSSTRLEDAGVFFEETMACLNIASANRRVVFFDSLGLVGILFQTKNIDGLRSFSYKILGKLIQEDKGKNNELIKTLYYYLNSSCNVHKTARAMNFSISGLRYRLQRLNELLQVDLNRPAEMHQAYLALQSLIVLGELDIDEGYGGDSSVEHLL